MVSWIHSEGKWNPKMSEEDFSRAFERIVKDEKMVSPTEREICLLEELSLGCRIPVLTCFQVLEYLNEDA